MCVDSAQNKYIRQDSDYMYKSNIFKFSNHFHLYKKPKYSWEITAEASYYSSKHECYNIWHEYFTSSSDIEGERARFLPLKHMNEYVGLNILVQKNCMSSYGSLYKYRNKVCEHIVSAISMQNPYESILLHYAKQVYEYMVSDTIMQNRMKSMKSI